MKRVLLTRPRAQSEAFARELAADGVDAAIWPVIEIADLPYDPPPAHQAVALTSAAAARRLTGPTSAPAYCVGAATATAARQAGFADVINANGDAAALARRITDDLNPGNGPIWWPCGAHTAQDLRTLLPAFQIIATPVYQAEPTGAPDQGALMALTTGEIHAIALFSPRSAAIFAAKIGGQKEIRRQLGRITGIAISENAAAPLVGLGLARVLVAERPNSAAMRAAIRSALA